MDIGTLVCLILIGVLILAALVLTYALCCIAGRESRREEQRWKDRYDADR